MTSEDQLTIITALRVLAEKMDLLINLLVRRWKDEAARLRERWY